ncbi:MAG: hypothetical protein MUF40_01120 [Gemmatimonadaceae bacterium]|jgi:hypothetical protein|nr:hypothetical protein [Gemmatimonadaceae bacterium]
MSAESLPAVTAGWLVGTWRLLRCDAALEFTPGTRMQFHADATLDYHIPTDDGELRARLHWRLAGAVLHTDLAEGGNPVTVGVVHGRAGVLEFDFGGARAWFVRETPARG